MNEPLIYLQGYPESIQQQVRQLLDEQRLGPWLLQKYPKAHQRGSDKALFVYVRELKSRYLRKAAPLNRVCYDSKIQLQRALGLHTQTVRSHGGKLKARHEIRIAAVLKVAPEALLELLVVHELAHLKEWAHDRAFYKLCCHMLADYHQRELDLRLYLTCLEHCGPLYGAGPSV